MSLRYDTCVSEYGINLLKVSYPNCETIELEVTDIFKGMAYFDTLYDPVNEYVAMLPDASQKEMYDIFYSLYVSDDKNNFDDQVILNKMEVKIKRVVELFNYEEFRIWNRHQSVKMFYPENIIDDYIHDPDGNTMLEKTYVKREYTDLTALVGCIRAVAPLYIDFYNRIKQVTQHYYYKIFMLFVRSELAECDEVEKLRTYIDVNRLTLIGTTKNENLILFAGLADDDILDSLLSEVIFNKLLPIDFINQKSNIVSYIFNTIKYKGNHAPANGQFIRGKSIENNPAKDDISYFEDYRKTSNLPVGTVVELQHALSDVRNLVQAIGETNFDYTLYAYEIENIKRHLTYKLDKTQVFLLGWFMNKIINPRALYYIEYRKLVELMLFAKVILTQHGHHYIAMVMSAKKTENPGYLGVVIKNSMSKESVRKLTKHYDYCIEEDKASTIEKTILEVSKEIANTTWIAQGTPEQLKKVSTAGIYLETPSNINEIVLEFVEFVNA